MVASNNNVVVTKVRSVSNNNDIIRNRSNSPHTNKSTHQFPRKVVIAAGMTTTNQQDEFHDSVSSSTATALPIPKGNDNNNNSNSNSNSNNHLRRVHSDNLAQSKRNNPNIRRSIFGQYFTDKPQSYSANHLVRGQEQQQLPPPPPPLTPQHPLPQQQPNFHMRRSSSSLASSSGSTTSGEFHNPQQEDNSNNDNNNRSYRHFVHGPVDYRVFAPSREQSATSAICNRFQELNKEHEQDYESLLERQITEQSLPPFPSPLRRFCSETTTATIAGAGAAAAVAVGDSSCFLPSSRSSSSIPVNGTYNHHYCGGVYSLLTPVSILRPAKYSNSNNNNESTDSTSDENSTEQNETGEQQQLPPPSMSSSFNVPRSFQGPSTTLKNFVEATASAAASVSNIDEEEEEEEKKENDNLTTTIISATTTAAASNYKGLREDFCDVVDSEEKMEQEEEERELHPEQQQRIRFDPRVTVTEFEDDIRKWYEEEELDQLKREAIALAQSYLRQHPTVAKWYQTAKLDHVTKTYRKKALYSLPVFSSSYSNNAALEEERSPNTKKTDDDMQSVSSPLSSSFQQPEELTPSSVKKILIVEPHPAIASLFCKSMKSMFPSAELITASSGKQASRMIKQSFIPNNNNRSTTKEVDTTTTSSFDIIIVEQNLTPKATMTQQNNNNTNSNKKNIFQGFIDTLLNKNTNHEESKAASVSCEIHYGSDLIELISKLMAQQQQDHNNDRSSSCLIIGVSFQPDRVAEKMIRSGADFVWGKPIPNVGDALRNNLLLKLLAKRNPSSD
jgi:hypothetical protein